MLLINTFYKMVHRKVLFFSTQSSTYSQYCKIMSVTQLSHRPAVICRCNTLYTWTPSVQKINVKVHWDENNLEGPVFNIINAYVIVDSKKYILIQKLWSATKRTKVFIVLVGSYFETLEVIMYFFPFQCNSLDVYANFRLFPVSIIF